MKQEKWWVETLEKVEEWCSKNGYHKTDNGDFWKYYEGTSLFELNIMRNLTDVGGDFCYKVYSAVSYFNEDSLKKLINAMEVAKADFIKMLNDCNIDNHNNQQIDLLENLY
jgi:hypothetical protein